MRKLVLVSRDGEQSGLEWNNAELVTARGDQDLVRFVSDLKAQPGKDIHLSGGARLAQSMARLGLIDEYRFFVHPVVSPGASWFAQLEDGLGLELISAAAYRDGVVAAYYRPRNT
jgi:dihydrofolate reductase